MSVMVAELYEALRKAGVDEGLARQAAEAVVADLVTKTDLRATTSELRTEMSDLKSELIKWNVGTLIAMTALFSSIVTILKLFT